MSCISPLDFSYPPPGLVIQHSTCSISVTWILFVFINWVPENLRVCQVSISLLYYFLPLLYKFTRSRQDDCGESLGCSLRFVQSVLGVGRLQPAASSQKNTRLHMFVLFWYWNEGLAEISLLLIYFRYFQKLLEFPGWLRVWRELKVVLGSWRCIRGLLSEIGGWRSIRSRKYMFLACSGWMQS